MSKIAQLHMELMEAVIRGDEYLDEIAERYDVPVSWVREIERQVLQSNTEGDENV